MYISEARGLYIKTLTGRYTLVFRCGFVRMWVRSSSSISGANFIPGMSNIDVSETTTHSTPHVSEPKVKVW